VAIKVLRQDLASDPERLRRFEQEARAASALDHPNIITIHDISESDGVHYIVMQYVDGKTLREVVSEGPLPSETLFRFATQIAEGLAKAHAAGIIHRDLKPENLMVTSDGYVKILDFGLAKLLPQPGVDSEAATITKEGTVGGAVMGTASYMSPEQALGNPLDARSDVFSLGAVLYEMATGKKPFQGETPARLFDQILHEGPASPSSLNKELPGDFDKIIARTLEKDLQKRYASAKELLAGLITIRMDSSSEAPQQKSIVVLPFENMSPDPDQEYFCDGMTDEIISDLSKLEALRVISRSSAMTFKGTKKKVRDIASEVNVQYVLEGSVRKAGNNLRITAQLIDASNDAHLWTEKYSGTLEDIFDIQETVSRSIVDALKLKLDPEEDGKISARPITDVRAYECYLQARYHVWRLSEESLERALELLERGFDIIGGNDLLYALKGLIYVHYVSNLMRPPDTYANLIEQARQCAAKALALNPSSAPALFIQGLASFKSGNPLEARRYWARAVDIDPNHVDANCMLGYLLAIGGRDLDGSLRRLEKAAKLDPCRRWPIQPRAGFMCSTVSSTTPPKSFSLGNRSWSKLNRRFP
jgi:serine/threonine protein kinase